MPDPKFSGVPVVPNASVVRGRLLSVKADSSDHGSEWSVAVDEARDVANLPNFVQDYVGKTITVHVHSELKPALAEQDRFEARIAFRGDERGGLFTIIEDDVRKL